MILDVIGDLVCRIMKSDVDIRENGIFREPERSKLARFIITGTIALVLAGCAYLGIRYGI